MSYDNIFNNFAAAFESAVEDGDWSRLEKYLAENATYLNVGGPDPKSEGKKEVINFLKEDVKNTDKRFDTRTLTAITEPKVEGNRLSRRWRCIYTLAGAPDLVVEGEARYHFENDLIKEIEEEITSDSMRNLRVWIEKYGKKLHT